MLQKKRKGQQCSKGNADKPKGKCYNCRIKRHYACKCRKPKKDNHYIAAATSKDKKPKKEKPETRTGKTKEIHLLVKNVRELDSNDSSEVSEEDQSVSDILPLEKETSPEETQGKMKQMAKAATIVI